MSESSDKLTAFSRHQPLNRGQRPSKVKKVVQKKVKVKNQQQSTIPGAAVTRPKNSTTSPPVPTATRRVKQGLIVPAAVKPIPNVTGKIPPFQPSSVQINSVRVPKQLLPKMGRRASRKTRLKPMARTMLYILRLLIVGVGMGAIVGTALSILDPANRITPTSSTPSNVGRSQSQPTPTTPATSSLYLSQENISLKNAVQNLMAANPSLTPGVLLVDLDTGSYVDINSSTNFPAASTIKVPILIAFFQDVDAGKIRLDEMLTMQQDMVAGGSGNLQSKPVGTQYTALDVATKMITISDNTATNMLIARLGGIDALNQRFRTWGLTTTVIRNQLPDLQGTNISSPRELGNLMAMVNQGNFVNMRSRDLILDIMRRTERDNLLPSGLGAGARVYHKTGDIGTMLADTGLVTVPNGKRYIATVMVQRPNNDPRAEKLISSISRAAYQEFSQNTVTPNNTTSNIPTNGYQPQVVNPALSNGTIPNLPNGGYQSPVISPPLSNGTGSIPATPYPSPAINPQYYPPR